MIIKGNSRSAGQWWAGHLLRADTNERVEVVEISGLGAENIRDGFSEMEAVASGTQCKNYAYIVSLNPREEERLSREQWLWAVDRTAAELGLTGQPRMIVQHDKAGRQHWHVVWSRIDADSMTAISDSLTYPKHERAARAIEQELELEPVASVLVKDRETERPERRPKDYEGFRAQESHIDPHQMKAQITALWHEADSGLAFKAALEQSGYILARGDRRGFCIVDSAGDEHSLARRVSGAKAADIRARLCDIALDELPSVAEARAQARAQPDEDSRPATDANEQASPQESALDAAQAAAFVTEPKAEISPSVAEALAARFGDRFTPSIPGAQSRANESIPGEVITDAARATGATDGDDAAAVTDCIRSHEPGERPKRVTPWSVAGLAERLTRYADLFWNFVRDENSGKTQAEGDPAEGRDPSEGRSWVSRIVEAGHHVVHGWQKRDVYELAEGVGEAVDIARDWLHGKQTNAPPEPGGEPARPDAHGNAFAPDAADPQREATAQEQATEARPVAPVSPASHFERFASRPRGAEEDGDRLPNLERFQTRDTAGPTPTPAAAPVTRDAPEAQQPEPDFD